MIRLHNILALGFALTCGILAFAEISEAAPSARRKVTVNKLNTVCTKKTKLPNSTYIYKQSAPIRSGGVGTPLIGYRKEPTLIMNSNVSNRWWTSIYDLKGNKLGSCPWADAHGHAGGRFRCTMKTVSLRNAAIKNTKKATIFIVVKGKSCVEITDAGRCYGSVKGLCDRLITK